MPEIRYFHDRDGDVVGNYLATLERAGDAASVAAYRHRLELLAVHGSALRMPYARMIDRSARIYELRVRAHRFAFIEHQGAILMLHAWRKRSQRLDTLEAATATRRAAIARERS